jgi:hypothetical protein
MLLDAIYALAGGRQSLLLCHPSFLYQLPLKGIMSKHYRVCCM